MSLKMRNNPIPLISWEQEIKSVVPLFKKKKTKNPQSKRREGPRDSIPTVNKSIFLSG